MRIVKRIFGVLYVLAAVAKAFPRVEDVGAVLRRAASANAGTPLAGVSAHLAVQALPVTIVAGVAMAAFGYSFLRDRMLAAAAIGQIAMVLCFITILHRAYPLVFLVDLPFFAAATFVLCDALRATGRERGACDAQRTVERCQP